MKLSAVPGPLVVALCVAAFLFGRFAQQGAQLPDPTSKLTSARKLGEAVSSPQDVAVAEHAAHPVINVQSRVEHAMAVPMVDPLDPVALSEWVLQNSGLTKMRPPMSPAASGDDFYRVIPYQILSWYPRIVVYPGFLDKARCDHVVALAKARMYPSGLAYRPGENGDANQQTRTSTGTFLGSESDTAGVLGWVEEKIAAVSLVPADNGEAFNVLHYQNQQHYDSHYDTFDPKDFGLQPNQRIATVLLYLSHVEEGGETVFKKEGVTGEARPVNDWRNCDDGSFKYMPRMGDAVLFWGTLPDGRIDAHALHGGCPVKKGEKWVATKWIRAKGAPGY